MRKMRKKQKKLENVYSNYTLNKIKTFILKRIDVIEISYDELNLIHYPHKLLCNNLCGFSFYYLLYYLFIIPIYFHTIF